ncbi:hypothetical protein AB0I66_41890 [Streptomyces sp. NPDC050439]
MYDTAEDDRIDPREATEPSLYRVLRLAGVDDDDIAEPNVVRGID